MSDSLVVESRVRAAVSETKGAESFRVAGDAVEALSAKVEQLVKEAVKRAKENGRVTVMKQDF